MLKLSKALCALLALCLLLASPSLAEEETGGPGRFPGGNQRRVLSRHGGTPPSPKRL